MKGFGDVKGNTQSDRLPKIEDFLQTVDWGKTKGKYLKIRVLPPEKYPFVAIGRVWVTKEVDGERGVKEVKFPRLAFGYNPVEDDFAPGTQGKDPYIENGGDFQKHYYVNCIVEVLEGKRGGKPTKQELKTGFKDIDSESETAVRAIRFPISVIREFAKLEQLNETKIKVNGKTKTKTFPISHEKYGRWLMISNDPKQPPAKQYSVQLGDRAPLSEKQLTYLTWDLVGVASQHYTSKQSLKEVMAEYEKDFGEEEKPKGNGAGKGKTYFEDDDVDDDAPKKKKKVKKIDPDDDIDLDADDERPERVKGKVKKSKGAEKSSKLKKKLKSKRDADDDAPKKVKGEVKKKSKDFDEDDIPF